MSVDKLIKSLWVNEGISIRDIINLTWPEILFYLGAKLDDESRDINESTDKVIKDVKRLSRETGRTRFGLHELV